jgi:hypothetical protein
VIRSLRVVLDADLAELYGVPTKALNQAVKRNAARFPPDFMFQLNAPEKAEVVTNCDHLSKLKFSKALPFAFTEYGAVALANVQALLTNARCASLMYCAKSLLPTTTAKKSARCVTNSNLAKPCWPLC